MTTHVKARYMKQWSVALIPFLILSILTAISAREGLISPYNATAATKPSYHKEAAALFNEFETNEKRSNALYNDRVLSVKGKVIQVTLGDSIQTVLLGEESGVNGILCQLDPGQIPEPDDLKPGLTIQIKGVCTGLFMDVVMVRCVREKVQSGKKQPEG